MRKNRRLGLTIAFAVLAGVTTATAAGAAPSSTTSTASQSANEICGYWEDRFGSSFYTHCGKTDVAIRTIYQNGTTSEGCVAPGRTFLDGKQKATYAYYIYPC
ncbi:DUF6355 family natural product biosynthesis protein [Allokutzneria multivorans]|uniref:DUF6355 family natural product biosynthesis protein n=1 Tax=Allokutzneria multivorans TaxID=1142134 RepID=UPI003CD0ACF8